MTLIARNNCDNEPDLESAINMTEFESGTEANLTEKPHNAVEVSPGGPFLLRILHQQVVRFLPFFRETISHKLLCTTLFLFLKSRTVFQTILKLDNSLN